eukprot:scaffold114_cov361-Pinguiococcus_pyrenoidosus.AAC.10
MAEFSTLAMRRVCVRRSGGPFSLVKAVRITLAAKTRIMTKKLIPRKARMAPMFSARELMPSTWGTTSLRLLSFPESVRPTPAMVATTSSRLRVGTMAMNQGMSAVKQRRPARDARWLS